MDIKEIIKDLKFYVSALKQDNIMSDTYKKDFDLVLDTLEKQLNGGWIPVTERLPIVEIEVLIVTNKGIITTAMYEDGTVAEEESNWNWYDIDFNYDDNRDIYLIPKGWWEYKHYNPDDVYNNEVDDKVIAWMPLPEPYKVV